MEWKESISEEEKVETLSLTCFYSGIIPWAGIFDSLDYLNFSPPYKIVMLNWILVLFYNGTLFQAFAPS